MKLLTFELIHSGKGFRLSKHIKYGWNYFGYASYTHSGAIGFFKDKISFYYFDYGLIKDFDTFRDKLVNIIRPGNKYAFLLKVKRDDGGWGMVGKHTTYLFLSDYEDTLNLLHKHLLEILDEYIEDYNYCGLDIIQLMVINVKRLPDLEVYNINNLKLDKNLVRIGETKRNFNRLILPLTMNDLYYGNKLLKKFSKEGLIKEVYLDGKNIITLIDKNSLLVNKGNNPGDVEFYEFINLKNKKYIILMKKDKNNTNLLEVFLLDGNKLLSATDFKINDEEFKRRIGNFTLWIKGNVISKYEVEDKLPIIKPLPTELEAVRNSNIGSLDLETYFNPQDNKSHVYALGYKIFRSYKTNMFYKSKSQSSNELVIECINSMLISKYMGFIFYVHNFSGFDVVFILSALAEHNLKNNNYYKLEPIFRDDRIIKLKIGIKTKAGSGGWLKISLVDSYNLLNKSLEALAIDFECEHTKGKFCHQFVNESTLYYIGNTPGKEYFKGINDEEYYLIEKPDWDLKTESLKYLARDLDCLLEIIDKFNFYVYLTYDLQITNCLTISRLAINIFRYRYLDQYKGLPLILKPTIFNFIKKGYYGGITEVYKPYCNDGYYYDVNSEYPFVAKNKIPGHRYTYIEDNMGKGLNLDKLFGFFYCKVKTNNGYLGLLPMHIEGSLILPNGDFYGVWFSEELKFAKDHGYEITVIRGYNFNILENVFNKFVDDLYDIRQKSKGMIKTVTKFILNSAFGRFGMNINKPITEIVNKDKLDYILSTHVVMSLKVLNENSFIVSYDSVISKPISDKSGLNYIKVLESNKKDYENNRKIADVSITTAAAVTAYARIHINTIKLWILSNGGILYYSDTDSVVTNLKLPDEMLGNEMGQLKLEYKIKKAYFITSKTYMMELYNGDLIKKAKGVYAENLNKSDYENLYYKNQGVKAIKGDTYVDFEQGTVNIKDKEVMLHYNAYTKRQKIFNEGLWVDTKPIVI